MLPDGLSRTLVLSAILAFAATWIAGPALAAQAADDDGLKGYRLAPGFRAQIAASEPMIVNPVTMTWGPDGKLYVSEWYKGRGPNDQIKVLSDTDGDGRFDQVKVYIDHLDLPAGICFWDGWTYITLEHDIIRMKDADGDGKWETRQTIATGFGNDNSHHRVSGLIIGPDGWLYITTGDSDAHARGSDGSEATVLRCGGVFRCKPDGSRMENVAFGMRNPWGNVAFDDGFNIFHTDNDNEGSPGFTGCRILHVVSGGDYGWRLRQGAACCQPDFERATWNDGRPGRLGWITETGRGAPAGLCVLNSAAFPPSKRNLLVYPDVFRRSVRAYEVEPKGGTYELRREFELLGADDPLFRPDDAEVGPDGALYVLDWRTDSGGAGKLSGDGIHGRIYRLTWGGTPREPALKTLSPSRLTAIPAATDLALSESLLSQDYGLRNAACLELIRRGGAQTKLRDLAVDPSRSPFARYHALCALAATTDGISGELWNRIFRDPDPQFRRVAYDLAARSLRPLAITGVEKDVLAIRAFAIALGAQGQLSLKKKMSEGTIDPEEVADRLLAVAAAQTGADEFVRDGIARGLDRMGPIGIRALERSLAAGTPVARLAAFHVIESLREPLAAALVLKLATGAEKLPAGVRAGLFLAYREICQLHGKTPELDGSESAMTIAGWLRHVSPDDEPEAQVQATRLLRGDHSAQSELAMSLFRDKLMKSPDPSIRHAALLALADRTSEPVGRYLLEVAKDRQRPLDERIPAVAGLKRNRASVTAPELRALAESSADESFLRELFRTTAAVDYAYAARWAETLLDSPISELRNDAIRLLGEKPKTAELVVKAFNDGRIPRGELSRVIEAARNHATPSLQAAVQLLLKTTVLAEPGGAGIARLRDHVNDRGDAKRGQAIFLDAKKGGCAVCHRLEGVGGAIGPDLTRVYETLSFEKRVESIVEPSREIKEGFGTYRVATTDGRVVVGLLVSQTPELTIIKDAQGQEIRILANQIEQKGPDPTSIMPAGAVGNLSLDELADLLTFLGDRKAQEALRGK
jgi:putative membrane-bound dehydrogenase-like protein